MSELHLDYPLVSVIVPTYNNEARIEKTLRSIIAQDYPNIEIIVVNDVSTDSTATIARRVLTAWGGQFKVIDRSVNGGQSASRNTGLNLAQGQYVIFFDHDDLAEKNYISRLCSEAEGTGADLVFCGFKIYHEGKNRYEEFPIKLSSPLQSANDYIAAWLKGKLVNCVWCFIFRKIFLDKNGIRFKESCYVGEDIEFTLKAFGVSTCTSFVKDPLYIWVHHPAQQTAGGGPRTADFQSVKLTMLYRGRAARYIIKHGTKRARDYMLCFYIPKNFIKRCTDFVEKEDKISYERQIRMLRHRKIRTLLLSSVKFLCFEPEVFLKAVLLLWCPRFYYWLRS